MCICVKGYVSNFADIQTVICCKPIQKSFCGFHRCCISCHTAEITIHGIGNIHYNHNCHIRFFTDLTQINIRLYLKRNVKNIFKFCSFNRLAYDDGSIFRLIRTSCIHYLLIGCNCFLCICTSCAFCRHQYGGYTHLRSLYFFRICFTDCICEITVCLKPSTVSEGNPVCSLFRFCYALQRAFPRLLQLFQILTLFHNFYRFCCNGQFLFFFMNFTDIIPVVVLHCSTNLQSKYLFLFHILYFNGYLFCKFSRNNTCSFFIGFQ